MPADHLNLLASWASIISLVVSTISLFYLRSIKANIIKFRRKVRLRKLISEVDHSWCTGTSASRELESKLASLQRNLPIYPWSKFTARGKVLIEVHRLIEAKDLDGLREALKDLKTFWEEA